MQVAGTLQKSTEVMKLVNDLIKAPQLNQTVQQMSKEMMKAGVIDEMMDDAIESAIDSDDIEEETDAEVDKVKPPSACVLDTPCVALVSCIPKKLPTWLLA